MIAEIINPSEKYTLVTDDFKCAAVAVMLLGSGHYGLAAEDGQSTPTLVGWDVWIKENFDNIEEYISQNMGKMADILDTVLIGDRKEVEETLPLIPEDQQEKWLNDRHDRLRKSENDIGANAKIIAERLRIAAKIEAEEREIEAREQTGT